jgi:hypothetical protein
MPSASAWPEDGPEQAFIHSLKVGTQVLSFQAFI